MYYGKTTLVAILATLMSSLVQAGVSADEAKQLGNSLTPIGAEKAGNKDNSIPAYTGGLTTPPAGFKAGDGQRPDPFAGEKPLFVIDGKSQANYAELLTEGTKALLQKYPDFRVDVYKTQRTVAFPKFVETNTAKCAQSAQTINDGRTIQGCHAGFPFPIPKTGFEAIWNHLVRYNGGPFVFDYKNWHVNSAGRPTLATSGTLSQHFPFWDKDKADNGIFLRQRILYTGPARRVGEGLLVVDPLDFVDKDRRAWVYLPGQRRVKVAPDIAHDTPNPGSGGTATFDDAYLFSGSLDRFDFKLIGKKEVIVPYNTYRLSFHTSAEQALKPNFVNPDAVRWERHRVWVVEANLREGKRHVYSKRRFYLDEDSWTIVASEAYDARGQIYRAGYAYQTPLYDLPAPYADLHAIYDLVGGGYSLIGHTADTGGVKSGVTAERDWTPDALAGGGIR
ncbi:MAG TPA: DUF1329 domain-containing protein [Rhodocyclaceae bacterium]|nr:DUF1329 domain-containing protein [Rhodocyclaceae bacterium]